ncbi:MAG TPA: flagellar filament outer layer protein FlaA, partial [Rectinemataceae bacterium]|nr:flagellar filament outer layer protein FlaA [Rectinemataceae bacterium]
PTTVGAPNAAEIGVDTAQQKLKEVSVDKFEEEGYWYPTMSTDSGFISARLFLGGPAGKANDPLPDERLLNINNQVADTHVLGVKVEFLHRGSTSFEVRAAKPIPIEGITKTISVWVVGRNYDNVLEIIVSDFFGREYTLPMGTLNFQGWKKMTIAIPPQGADGSTGIVQRNFHYASNMGIKVVGFKILCDPMQAYGSYYIYFDDMRAVTDLFAEDNRDPDDMSDAW